MNYTTPFQLADADANSEWDKAVLAEGLSKYGTKTLFAVATMGSSGMSAGLIALQPAHHRRYHVVIFECVPQSGEEIVLEVFANALERVVKGVKPLRIETTLNESPIGAESLLGLGFVCEEVKRGSAQDAKGTQINDHVYAYVRQ